MTVMLVSMSCFFYGTLRPIVPKICHLIEQFSIYFGRQLTEGIPGLCSSWVFSSRSWLPCQEWSPPSGQLTYQLGLHIGKYGVRSPKFFWAPVYNCAHWLRHRNHPPSGLLSSYTRALLVSQDIRHSLLPPGFTVQSQVGPHQDMQHIKNVCTDLQVLKLVFGQN